MAEWIHEYLESKTGDWGKPGRTYCSECKGGGLTDFKFCPWCGRKMCRVTVIRILCDGDMYDPR